MATSKKYRFAPSLEGIIQMSDALSDACGISALASRIAPQFKMNGGLVVRGQRIVADVAGIIDAHSKLGAMPTEGTCKSVNSSGIALEREILADVEQFVRCSVMDGVLSGRLELLEKKAPMKFAAEGSKLTAMLNDILVALGNLNVNIVSVLDRYEMTQAAVERAILEAEQEIKEAPAREAARQRAEVVAKNKPHFDRLNAARGRLQAAFSA
ncbi:MAG: hypothetical protein WA051_00615 [Minisyncoccia bacterium]